MYTLCHGGCICLKVGCWLLVVVRNKVRQAKDGLLGLWEKWECWANRSGCHNGSNHIMVSPSCCILPGLVYLVGVFWIDTLEVFAKVVGFCVHRGCWKRHQRAWPFRFNYNGIFSCRKTSLVLVRWGLRWAQWVRALEEMRMRANRALVWCITSFHPLDPFGVGCGETLFAVKVSSCLCLAASTLSSQFLL